MNASGVFVKLGVSVNVVSAAISVASIGVVVGRSIIVKFDPEVADSGFESDLPD